MAQQSLSSPRRPSLLRRALLALSGLFLTGTVVVGVVSRDWAVFLFYGVVQALILGAALLFEAPRYRAQAADLPTQWQPTSEVFQDPSTGQWTAVEYNPATGARRYVPAAPPVGSQKS
jgi:hypothetical protein